MWMIKNHEALLKMNEIENVALGFYLLFKAFNRVSCSKPSNHGATNVAKRYLALYEICFLDSET